MIFRKGQPLPTEREMRDIIRCLQSRIVGGKNINVRTFGDRIIVEKIKPRRKKKEIDDRIPLKTHGMFFATDQSWTDYGYSNDDWDTWVANYNLYNTDKCHYTIVTWDQDVTALYGLGEALPDNITLIEGNTPIYPADIDEGGCVFPGIKYLGTCRFNYAYTQHPDDEPVFDKFWAYSAAPAGGAVYTEYIGYFTDALNAVNNIEGFFHFEEDSILFANHYDFLYAGVWKWAWNILTWTWGGDGLKHDPATYGGYWTDVIDRMFVDYG